MDEHGLGTTRKKSLLRIPVIPMGYSKEVTIKLIQEIVIDLRLRVKLLSIKDNFVQLSILNTINMINIIVDFVSLILKNCQLAEGSSCVLNQSSNFSHLVLA